MIDVINQANHIRFKSTESQLHSHEVPIIAVECYFLYIAEAIDENAFLLYAYNACPPDIYN
jgi:hypothetical protein